MQLTSLEKKFLLLRVLVWMQQQHESVRGVRTEGECRRMETTEALKSPVLSRSATGRRSGEGRRPHAERAPEWREGGRRGELIETGCLYP